MPRAVFVADGRYETGDTRRLANHKSVIKTDIKNEENKCYKD
jgi:hypothetical protein